MNNGQFFKSVMASFSFWSLYCFVCSLDCSDFWGIFCSSLNKRIVNRKPKISLADGITRLFHEYVQHGSRSIEHRAESTVDKSADEKPAKPSTAHAEL